MNRSSAPNSPPRMKRALKVAVAAAACALAGHAMADITFYENENFRGRNAGTESQINFLKEIGFDDRASSIEVRGERWEVCEDPGYSGRCRVLQPGSYPSLKSMGLDNRISSARRVGEDVSRDRYGPDPQPTYFRRGDEGLYQAQVVSVRAVMGEEQQRCWIEQKEVRDRPNVGGAVVGGVLGGILGHQFGGGSGQTATTVAGAVGGAVVGSNVNRDKDVRNVQRCGAATNNGNPQYWDVTYRFKGQDHYMQTRRQPGATVTVNARGEPRE
ncbi:beta/gamma crystallin family protein [Mitsuaria sp. 7]|uniref:beta/gamma crystallin family protein n=1 Tax=Mitsuaria sp. 7 TaxID=1658665 RepID=UPI0018D2E83D|nr:beta/gamma crystallin family protein [Mitsuaria sp. 7]